MMLLPILFYLIFVGFILYVGVQGLTLFKREFSGSTPRAYADICADLYRETERRGDLLAAYVRSRDERIQKLERR